MKPARLAVALLLLATTAARAAGWDPFVDLVLQDPNIRAAGIYGLDGNIWSQKGLEITKAELPALAKGADDVSAFQANGMVAAGVKYFYLNTFANGTIVGRKG